MGWLKYVIDDEKRWLKEHDEKAVLHKTGKTPVTKALTPSKVPSATEVSNHSLFEDFNKRS